ncbi:MAG: hypothetical protein IJ574_04155 [Bacilli bacterium]|nr:hypothetical protein [Bacilli bacterium]
MNLLKKIWNDFRMVAILGIIFIGLIVLLLLFALIKGPADKSYQNIENIMKQAASKYYEDNKGLLPVNIGDVSNVNSDALVAAKYMEPLTKYRKSETCNGHVEVEKTSDTEYFYQAYLDCGENYKTEKFSNVINEIPIVTTGDGLYQIGNEKVFRGQLPNNYVQINYNLETNANGDAKVDSGSKKQSQNNSSLWRILKIDSNDLVYLILDTPSTDDYTLWDDSYNVERENNYGINEYGGTNKNSKIYTYVNDAFDTSSSLHTSLKEYLASFDLCTGKRAKDNTTKNGISECNIKLKNQIIGLLPLYEYMRASLDESCISSLDAQCQNYNYLASSKESWWTITASSSNTYYVYKINYNGKISEEAAAGRASVRYVVALNKHVLYSKGDGSKDNPYILSV